jgi:hypothetical protein
MRGGGVNNIFTHFMNLFFLCASFCIKLYNMIQYKIQYII